MKSRVRAISVVMTLLIVMIASQSCDTTMSIDEPKRFYKLIGTDGDQVGIDLVTDANDAIYVLGTSTTTSDGIQVYVVKTTPKGEVLWEKMFGDAGDELAKDIELTAAGSLVVVADRTDISTGEKDFVIYRINADDGSLIGTPTIGGYPGKADYVNSVTESLDGFLVSTYSDNGTFKEGNVFRYDASMALFPNTWQVNISQVAQVGGFDFVPVKSVHIRNDMFLTFCYSSTTLIGDLIPDYNFVIYVSNEYNDQTNFIVVPGPDPNSNERLTSVRPVPVQSGGGFVLAGYVSNPSGGTQDLYLMQVRQELKGIDPSDLESYMLRAPKAITSQLSPIVPNTNASVYPSKTEGYILLGNQNTAGNDNIFLTKVNKELADAWESPHTSYSFGGEGNDMPGAVIETSDGRILLCGTMVLGNAIGQKKIVLINVNPVGMFDE